MSVPDVVVPDAHPTEQQVDLPQDLRAALGWLRASLPDPVTGSTTWRPVRARAGVLVAVAGASVAKAGTNDVVVDRLRVGVDAASYAHRLGAPATPPLLPDLLDAPFGGVSLWPRVPGGVPVRTCADPARVRSGVIAATTAAATISANGTDTVAAPADPDAWAGLGDLLAPVPGAHGRAARRLLATVSERTTTAWASQGMPFVRAHGDLHLGNVVVSPVGAWVIDWDSSGYWPYGWDAATLHASVLLSSPPSVARTVELDPMPGWPADPALVAGRVLSLSVDRLASTDPRARARVLDIAAELLEE